MRGGRGGRGRGGFRGGFGHAQAVPLTPIDTYIYNPNCEEKPELSEEEKRLVVLNRIIVRSCNEGESYVHSEPFIKLVSKYMDDFEADVREPSTQRRLLVDAIGPQYFPDELLSIKPPLRSGRQTLGAKKTLNWKSLEEMERANRFRGAGAADDEDEDEADEDDEAGDHEDYGHNHYEDEDRDDEFIDDDGAGDDD
eukprot:Gregarina_sp_Poly_1__2794@NODE_1779_length_3346_cov_89_443123_g57_i1_p3_GENE_NODE_1779_length_3346_cov_89_443123_g57_i1NODE_1779_length_3346_cov_89_443123_g57_i1_p3_ORF_typecomplete_len196_score24_56RNA_pol_3_Rpc31/PF11705_8/5_4e15_NODE_1779_length_3346_cov_89_443123_g57_i120242611